MGSAVDIMGCHSRERTVNRSWLNNHEKEAQDILCTDSLITYQYGYIIGDHIFKAISLTEFQLGMSKERHRDQLREQVEEVILWAASP